VSWILRGFVGGRHGDAGSDARYLYRFRAGASDLARFENRGMNSRQWIFGFLCLASGLQAADLAAKIARALDSSKGLQRGYMGIKILDLASGSALFELNSDRLFVPASNTKLFTAALGLSRLGPDYRSHTTVNARSQLRPDGAIVGPLYLVGG